MNKARSCPFAAIVQTHFASGRCPCRPVDGRALPETVGEERTEGGRSVRKNIGGVVPRVTIRADGRVFRCEIHAGRNPDRARFWWV